MSAALDDFELRIGNSSHNFTLVLLNGVELVEFTLFEAIFESMMEQFETGPLSLLADTTRSPKERIWIVCISSTRSNRIWWAVLSGMQQATQKEYPPP